MIFALTGCGGSGVPSACVRWTHQAARDATAARAQGRQFAAQLQGMPGDPPAKLAAMAEQEAAALYQVEITSDLHSPRWRGAAKCATPEI